MAQIVTITNPLTGQPAQVDQLDHTAQQIDDGLNIARGVSNPNLLDNWYFGNPVNQRGQTSYTGAMHTIDRWGIYGYTSGAISLTHDGINISGSFDFGTVIEMSRMPDDSPITASFLFTDGFYYFTVANKYTFGAAQIDSGGAQCVWLPNWPTADAGTGLFFVNGNSFPSINRTFIAAKLELGSQQTLAHQENGVWVLNEIPDYGEQLAMCNMYQVLYGNLKSDEAFAPLGAGYSYNGNTIFVMLDLPQELCKSATKEVEIIGSLANFGLYYNQAEYVVPSAVSIDQVGTRYIGLKFTVTSTPASSYVLKPRTTGTGLLVKANL